MQAYTITTILANTAKGDPAKVNINGNNFALFMPTNAIYFLVWSITCKEH